MRLVTNVWASRISRARARRRARVITHEDLSERLLTWGAYTAVAVVVFQTAGHLYDWLATDLDIVLLNADHDQAVYAWVPTTAIFTGALALFLQQQIHPVTGFRRWLPAVLAYLSLDEMVALHERVLKVLDKLNIAASHGRVIWPVIYLPLLAATTIALWRMARTMVPRAGLFVQAGLVMLATAVMLEVGSVVLVDDYENAYQVEVVVEQNLELAGWTLIGSALLATAVRVLRRSADEASA